MTEKSMKPPQACLVPCGFTPQQVKEMHRLLSEIHDGLKDKNSGSDFRTMPAIELCWMIAIEEYLPKGKQLMTNRIKNSRAFSN